MAVSIDTRTALVRSLGQFWSHTRAQVCVPPGFLKPLPQPIKTHTPWCGYGFAWVRVRVALEYPRVTLDNPYLDWAAGECCWEAQLVRSELDTNTNH